MGPQIEFSTFLHINIEIAINRFATTHSKYKTLEKVAKRLGNDFKLIMFISGRLYIMHD